MKKSSNTKKTEYEKWKSIMDKLNNELNKQAYEQKHNAEKNKNLDKGN